MARLAKTVVEQRETEALEAFVKGASVKEVNEALFSKYGKRMGLKRIYELKASVSAKLVVEPTVVDAVVDAVVEPAQPEVAPEIVAEVA